MRLSDLRAATRDGIWGAPSAVRCILDIAGLTELVRDIDEALEKAKTGGYLEGIREYSQKHGAAMSRDLTHEQNILRQVQPGALTQQGRQEMLLTGQVSAAQCIKPTPHDMEMTAIHGRIDRESQRIAKLIDRTERLEQHAHASPQLNPAEHALAVLNLRVDEMKKLVEAGERRHQEHAKWHQTTKFGERIGELEAARKGETAETMVIAERFNDIDRRLDKLEASGQGVGEIRVTAPAASPLGVELSELRDRLNALEQQDKLCDAHCVSTDRRLNAMEHWRSAT